MKTKISEMVLAGFTLLCFGFLMGRLAFYLVRGY